MGSDQGQKITYDVRWRSANGTEHKSGPLMTRRRRSVGDLVNLPHGPDGRGRRGKGYIWRVTALQDDGTTLVVAFVRAHPGAVEDTESG